MFLKVDSLEEIKMLDKLYMVMTLCAMHPNFDHVRNQILIGQEISLVESLTT